LPPKPLKITEELELIIIAVSEPCGAINSFGMPVLIWLKYYNVKRL